MNQVTRSIVIPVLDFSPHSPHNIRTLLKDLADVPGEVICVFNSAEVFSELRTHERIDRYCFNSQNPGVSRSWNIGLNLAVGKAVFVLNADLCVRPAALDALEQWLFSLDRAVIVGPEGSHLDYKKLGVIHRFEKGTFSQPVQTNDVSGFFFAVHLERFLAHHLMFDARYTPCFFEEWDMGLQVAQAGLACYAVPVTDFEHLPGMSRYPGNHAIHCLGRAVLRDQALTQSRKKFVAKWPQFCGGKESR